MEPQLLHRAAAHLKQADMKEGSQGAEVCDPAAAGGGSLQGGDGEFAGFTP